jgi:putative hydrolase
VTLSNTEIAAQLDEVANLLEEQRANQYRVQAWRAGAAVVRHLAQSVGELLREAGLEGLDRLPSIGPALARAIRELAETGRLSTLERLRGELDPVAVIASVPGIGHTLAERIHDLLGIESLEQLEAAAHDGRLAGISGFGTKRLEGVRDALATRLRPRRLPRQEQQGPSVDELLDVDREYRERASREELPTIAPRRFNPTNERWLPILHTSRGDRHYTALFSNSATAHRLARTHDWVVIYFDGRDGEHQCTVIAAPKGPLAGHRIVRGRESECIAHYHLNAITTESSRLSRQSSVDAGAPAVGASVASCPADGFLASTNNV